MSVLQWTIEYGCAARNRGLSFVDPSKFERFAFFEEDLQRVRIASFLP